MFDRNTMVSKEDQPICCGIEMDYTHCHLNGTNVAFMHFVCSMCANKKCVMPEAYKKLAIPATPVTPEKKQPSMEELNDAFAMIEQHDIKVEVFFVPEPQEVKHNEDGSFTLIYDEPHDRPSQTTYRKEAWDKIRWEGK